MKLIIIVYITILLAFLQAITPISAQEFTTVSFPPFFGQVV